MIFYKLCPFASQEKQREEREEAARLMEEQAKILKQEHEQIKGNDSLLQVCTN